MLVRALCCPGPAFQDARYNRDRTNSGRADRDLLGEEQWQWLESELLNSTADVNIIGSGIQVLVEDRVLGENWLGHPAAHERLLRLIAQQQSAVAEPGLTFIISGDVHYAETHYECLSRYEGGAGRGVRTLHMHNAHHVHTTM